MIIPDHIDRNVVEKPLQCLRTPLVAMTGTILGQCRRPKVGARFVRRRRTQVVAVHRITEKQKKIELLGTHHIEDWVPGGATPAAPLATQIAAPGKGHRS